jgi:pyruvate kinase
LIRKAKWLEFQLIVATQMMMETMITSLTQQEQVNDVANSVMDGADAVMFETAAETIRFRLFKNDSNYRSGRKLTLIQVPQNTPQIKQNVLSLKTICRHAAVMANAIEAKAIFYYDKQWIYCFQLSAWRPSTATHFSVYI